MQVLAPGKLFILGEYAVTDGGPALVAAVDRGVRCLVSAGDDIQTPGDNRFAKAALQAVEAPQRRYSFSDWNPAQLSGKGGFGGSAAACTAAAVAGTLAAGEPVNAALCALAVQIHQAVQGSGSGMDVRASFHGGLRRYHGQDVGPSMPGHPFVAVYSGASAETGPRVKRYKEWSGRADFAAESAALLDLFGAEPCRAMSQAYALLRAMAKQAGLAYDTPALFRIAALAEAHGGAAKPSGAGGGDVAIALVPDPQARASFTAACALEGLTPVPIQLAVGAKEGPHV
ncbi:MAG: phosphomevalonate kinase [Cognaticolwellia sp.]|jgi:phosphomevalonate kinase